MIPPCPRCGAPMIERLNRSTGLAFWGCPSYPRCRGTMPRDQARSLFDQGPPPPHTDVTTLQATLRQMTRERDTLRAGYEQLLGEVRTLRRRAPQQPVDTLVRELTRLLSVIHPDKWGGESAVATALTQEVLRLREKLQRERA